MLKTQNNLHIRPGELVCDARTVYRHHLNYVMHVNKDGCSCQNAFDNCFLFFEKLTSLHGSKRRRIILLMS